MRQRLASADLSLAELLSGRYIFSIPAYQRDYTWGRDEALQLIDDIAAVLDDSSGEGTATPYFLGTMLFVEQPAANDQQRNDQHHGLAPQRTDVVDGQQRLITLAIVFAVLRDIAADEPEAHSLDALLLSAAADEERAYQLRLRSSDAEFFRAAIQTAGATRRGQPADVIGQSPARSKIEEVRHAVRRKFLGEYDATSRQAFARFARQHARVLVVSSDDFD